MSIFEIFYEKDWKTIYESEEGNKLWYKVL